LLWSIGGEDLVDSVSFVLWDGDRKARVVEDILEREEISIDDESWNATSVDCFESSSSPARETILNNVRRGT